MRTTITVNGEARALDLDHRVTLLDALREHLASRGVQTLVHYPIPPHCQQAYAHLRHLSLPLAERLHDEVLSLPLGPSLRADQMGQVVDACLSFPVA